MGYVISKKHIKLLIILAISLLLSLGYSQADDISPLLSRSQPGLYHVNNVNDGDTITVSLDGSEERVRMIGIDTPELHHPEKPVQCFAEAARQFTASLININNVRLEADP